jgi:hydroxypyruvate isomerase
MSDNDLLFETLDIISKHSNRLDKLDKNFKELINANKDIKESIVGLKSSLEFKIEKASKDVLKEVLDNIVINNNNTSDITVDTSSLAEEIRKLVNTKFNNSINIEPQNIKVDIDTKAIADKLDSTSLVKGINKQIEENSKATRVLLTEMLNIQNKPVSVVEDIKKTIKVIRDKNNLINSLEIVND